MTIPDQLNKKLEIGDSLYEKGGLPLNSIIVLIIYLCVVVSSREAVIDSEHIKLLSEIACHQSQASRGELIKFDPIKYREKLVGYVYIPVVLLLL